MLVELPQALSKNILSYLSVHSKDRLSTAASCHGLLNDVEAFSENELTRIAGEHSVDDAWLHRVRRQAHISAIERGAATSPIPTFSQRRMLRSAYQTHLYSLGSDPLERRHNVNCLTLHPDGKKLLSCDEVDNHLDLWDLQTRECTRSFRGDGTSCGFRSGRVVSYSDANEEPGIIQVWGLDGSRMFSQEIEMYTCTDLDTSSGDEVMWVDEQNVNALNILTGTTRRVEHGLSISEIAMQKCKPFCCKDRLLLWVEYDSYFDEGQEADYGIYVMDRSTLQELSRIEGRFDSFAVSHDGDVVARAHPDNQRFDAYHLENDHLVFRRSFYIQSALGLFPIKLLWNSKLYVSVAGDPDWRGCVDVYDTVTGVIERRLYYPRLNFMRKDAYMIPVQSRKEVLCGFCNRGFEPEPHIRAYLLED